VEGFKMEQIAATMFCVKLKNAATETFEMLKSAYGDECSSRKFVLECMTDSNKGSERENTQMNVESNVD
jgi:hypothetical protein